MRILSLVILFAFLIFSNQKTDSPHGADFKISCKTCHSAKSWKVDRDIYSFDHNKTKLPLVGQHVAVDCRQCHTSLVFYEAKQECSQCHSDVHQSTTGLDCERCHTPASWLVNNINEIHQRSRFPLLGAHRTADCSLCHKSESLVRFDVLGINCVDCHRNDYMATTNPNHVQSGMSEDCSQCHQVNAFQWSDGNFNHSFFPLAGGHSAIRCMECHTTGRFTDAKPDCYTCHQNNYLSAKSPDHSASQFSTACSNCHTLNPGWKPAAFDHSGFPLTLGHSIPACIDCHVGGNYNALPTDCYTCHQKDFLATTNPNHTSAGMSTACLTCHTTNTGWKPATFNHNNFPLTLGHASLTCADCHVNGNYTSTSADCYTCHQKDYTGATNPNHSASGFPTVCTQCHTTNPGWKPATFNHTAFPLTLGHATPACADCHKNGNYTNTPTDCYSCHQTDYTTAANPGHSAAGFPTTCAQCHTTNPGWKPATFNHTNFPLTLGHATPTCADCHKNGNYTTTPTACYSCHQADYNGAANPNHSAAGFPTTCTQCHTTNPGWKPATFNHTGFPLTLGHSTPACADCHKNGNYTTTPTDCYSCHQADYAGTSNPNHASLSFATVCTQCHTTNPGWKPASYTQHDTQFFPIYSGRHQGQWSVCSDCHTTANNYALFNCITCHANVHSGKNYTNAQCYSCHPRGVAGK